MTTLELQTIVETRLGVSLEQVAHLCHRWQITEFALFGSVLGPEFRSDSDVDVLVTFAPGHQWGWEIIDLKDELGALFGREVDLLTRSAISQSSNWLRRRNILASAEVVYAR